MSNPSVKMELVDLKVNTLFEIDLSDVRFEDTDRVVFEIFFVANENAHPVSVFRKVDKWSRIHSATNTFTPRLPGKYTVKIGKTSGTINYRSRPLIVTA